MAESDTIFKIRALTDYVTIDPRFLSFRRGQPFYALAVISELDAYFVSTQYAMPFASNAVTGLVPACCFKRVKLHSKDPEVSSNKLVAPLSFKPTSTRSASRKNAMLVLNQSVTLVHVLKAVELNGFDAFQIRVHRGLVSHIVTRSAPCMTRLHATLLSLVPITNLPEFPEFEMLSGNVKLQCLELYLNHLIAQPYSKTAYSESITACTAEFLAPVDSEEATLSPIERRDSAMSTSSTAEPECKKRRASFLDALYEKFLGKST